MSNNCYHAFFEDDKGNATCAKCGQMTAHVCVFTGERGGEVCCVRCGKYKYSKIKRMNENCNHAPHYRENGEEIECLWCKDINKLGSNLDPTPVPQSLKRFYFQWTQDAGAGLMECYAIFWGAYLPRTFDDARHMAVRETKGKITTCSLAFPGAWFVVEVPRELNHVPDNDITTVLESCDTEAECLDAFRELVKTTPLIRSTPKNKPLPSREKRLEEALAWAVDFIRCNYPAGQNYEDFKNAEDLVESVDANGIFWMKSTELELLQETHEKLEKEFDTQNILIQSLEQEIKTLRASKKQEIEIRSWKKCDLCGDPMNPIYDPTGTASNCGRCGR